jgi:hypothetical protein
VKQICTHLYIGKKEKLNCTKMPICFVLFQEICLVSMIRYERIYKLTSKGRQLSLISKNSKKMILGKWKKVIYSTA